MLNKVLGAVAVLALIAIFYFGNQASVAPVPEVSVPSVVVEKPVPGKKPTYHRVTQGGGTGEPTECKSIVPYTQGKTPAELADAAKQLGVTQADLAKYFVCVVD